MQYDFLKQFPRRMKNVGRYAILYANSSQKTVWKQFGFDSVDEQMNVIFSLLLYMMEQSLKEEHCTLDEIGAYLDNLNTTYFKKQMSYEDCRKLGDFIINVILSNEGRPMYFQGYNFEAQAYEQQSISYVANKVVYPDADVKRTSYYLTDDGYNLLLGTLEIESNMKLTIHEILFRMQLEKQNYDKAVDSIKNVFNLLRIQLQKIQDAMRRIRRNALSYSVADYQVLLEENMDTISDTRKQFLEYRGMVQNRVKQLEEEHINVQKLSEKEEENLQNLLIIENYLNRAIDEHQKILNNHLDLKALYTRELEELSQMSLIQRFSLRNELFDGLLQQPERLEYLDYFLRPLFLQEPEKIYNINKAFEIQRPLSRRQEIDAREELDFDEETWRKEQEQMRLKKMQQYETCLSYLLDRLFLEGEFLLSDCQKDLQDGGAEQLIPNVEIFKEVMVELLKSRVIDIPALQKERSEFIQESGGGFQLNEMLLNLLETRQERAEKQLERIYVQRTGEESVLFENVESPSGKKKSIRCSNVDFKAEWKQTKEE